MTPVATAPRPSARPLVLPTAALGTSPLRVAVRHAVATLSIRVAYIAQTVPPAARPDTTGQLAQVLAATEGLLREAGADPHHIVSCEVFVREPSARARVQALMRTGATFWHARSCLVKPPWDATPQADMGLALVVTRPCAAGHPL